MPWGEKTVLSSRHNFVVEAMQKEQSFSSLCRKYGITRATGYKWISRYKNGEPLTDRSRAFLRKNGKTPEIIEALVLKARDSHPAWGPRKLKRYLEIKITIEYLLEAQLRKSLREMAA
jgi:transposase